VSPVQEAADRSINRADMRQLAHEAIGVAFWALL
jgi:hypothetical protein